MSSNCISHLPTSASPPPRFLPLLLVHCRVQGGFRVRGSARERHQGGRSCLVNYLSSLCAIRHVYLCLQLSPLGKEHLAQPKHQKPCLYRLTRLQINRQGKGHPDWRHHIPGRRCRGRSSAFCRCVVADPGSQGQRRHHWLPEAQGRGRSQPNDHRRSFSHPPFRGQGTARRARDACRWRRRQ